VPLLARPMAGYPITFLIAVYFTLATTSPAEGFDVGFRVESAAMIPVGPLDSVFFTGPALSVGLSLTNPNIEYRFSARVTNLKGHSVSATTNKIEVLAGVAQINFLGLERAIIVAEVGASSRGYIEGFTERTISIINARRDTTWKRLGQDEQLYSLVTRLGLEYRIYSGPIACLDISAMYQGNYQLGNPAGTPIHTRSDNSVSVGLAATIARKSGRHARN
jgi:hypothetical protein